LASKKYPPGFLRELYSLVKNDKAFDITGTSFIYEVQYYVFKHNKRLFNERVNELKPIVVRFGQEQY